MIITKGYGVFLFFLNTDDVILKLYTSLSQKAKCTLFVWSTV